LEWKWGSWLFVAWKVGYTRCFFREMQ
jgi:hypothetical protein